LFFFGLIILLPFIGIFSKIDFDLDIIYNFFQNSYTHRLIYFSLYQAFLSELLSCFLAIPFALALNRHKNLKIIKFIISLCGFCFVIPTNLIVRKGKLDIMKNKLNDVYMNFEKNYK
jgi:thiamine transport system permease protein